MNDELNQAVIAERARQLKIIKDGNFTKEDLEIACAYFAARVYGLEGLLAWHKKKAAKWLQDPLSTYENLPADERAKWISAFDDGVRSRIQRVSGGGGKAKANPMDKLRAETIRLYEAGSWTSARKAAHDITPDIFKMSRGKGNGNLSETTQKPLEWIRDHIRDHKRSKK